ncbi:hypothetical protein AYL99_08642 [Fonsecaea erecta]|uniref:Transcription factor domain-containing protein n=1 Tax=Fonsecaea erecta TaxID=1367422 RepID=A0A178ZDL9_9EURO|nr:hypothetical protein AYL99_08642 [Fonsecaea erecta]OAP57904.1 hypothetical protein AYL99_08642 [Fonsecaea erecta]
MKAREVVFVDGLSWTKADKKIQISKVRTHARIIGLRKRELQGQASSGKKCIRQPRKTASISSVAHEHPSRPLASATQAQPQGSNPKVPRNPSLVVGELHTRPLEDRSGSTSTRPNKVFDISQSPRQISTVVLDPDPYLRGYRKDPFSVIPDNSCLDALDFYTQIYVPNNAPLYEVFNVTNIYDRFALLPLQHGLSLHAGLCNLVHEFEFFLDPAAKPSRRVYTYLGTALANLRREIEINGNLPNDISTITVMNLALGALMVGDQEAHELHKKHLRLMIQAKGGIDQLGHGGLEKCMMLQWEGNWCWIAGRGPTIFSGARINPNAGRRLQLPLDGSIRGLVSQLPGGFQSLAKTGVLSIPTLEALLHATEELERRKDKQSGTRKNKTLQYRRRRYDDLLQACPCLGDSDENPTLEKLIVLALVLYCFANFCTQRLPTTHFTSISVRATSNLKRTSRIATEIEKQALVWVFMVVIDSWRSRDGQMRSEGVDLLRLFKRRFTIMKSWNDVADLLTRFLWSEDMERFVGRSWPEA